jgi:hypothetical protein
MQRIEPGLVPVVTDLERGLRELSIPFGIVGALVPERTDRDRHARRRLHRRFLAAEDLDAELTAVERGGHLRLGLLVAARECVGRQELGDREADPELLRDGAER